MFDIGWSELVVIGVVALIAIGPKELPGVLRTVGQYMGKIRRMASEFQGQFNEAMREAEMADIKKSVDEMTDAAKGFTNFDPVESVKSGFEAATSDAPKPDASAAPGDASPEHVSSEPVTPAAAAAEMPAAVAPDVSIPQPEAAGADLAIAPEAPQPVAPELSPETKKAGSGA